MEKVLLSVFLGICILEADDVFGNLVFVKINWQIA